MPPRGPGRLVGELAQVEQADHGAVADDGRAGDQGQPAEERAELLDHQLHLGLEPVDGPGQLALAVADDEGGPGRPLAGDAEGRAEVEQRHVLVVPDDDRRAGEVVDLRVPQRHRRDHGAHRHRVHLVADPGDQAAQDAEGDRQRQPERRAAAGDADDLDATAELLRRRLHDVEPDAAAAGLGDRARGGERGDEQQLPQRGPGRRESAGSSPISIAFARTRSSSMPLPSSVTSRTTVPPDAAGRDLDRARALLALGPALVGGLAAVVDGVGDEVLERVGDPVENLLVQLDVLADQLSRTSLPVARGDVVDDPRQAGEHPPYGDHRQAHGVVADPGDLAQVTLDQLAQRPRRVAHAVVGLGQPVQRERRLLAQQRRVDAVAQHLGPAGVVGAAAHQLGGGLLDAARAQLGLADDVEQAVHLLARHPDRVAAGAAARRRGPRRVAARRLRAAGRPRPSSPASACLRTTLIGARSPSPSWVRRAGDRPGDARRTRRAAGR